MRISDWSSDVCSSDLGRFLEVGSEWRRMPRSAPGVTRKPMIESQGDTRQTQCAWCLRDHLETNRSLRFAARLRNAGAAVARLPAHGAVARGGRLRLPAGGGVPGVEMGEAPCGGRE